MLAMPQAQACITAPSGENSFETYVGTGSETW